MGAKACSVDRSAGEMTNGESGEMNGESEMEKWGDV
jgi:hypothetical protein